MASQFRPLIEILNEIPDPRHPRGKRYPISALLAATCMAFLCNYRHDTRIPEWCHNYGTELMNLVRLTRVPAASTFHYLFRHLDWRALEAKIHDWVESILQSVPPLDGEDEAVALDGKTLRRSKAPPVSISSPLSAIV